MKIKNIIWIFVYLLICAGALLFNGCKKYDMSNVVFTNRTNFVVEVQAYNGSTFDLKPDSSYTIHDNESHVIHSRAFYFKVEDGMVIQPYFNHTDDIQEDNMIYNNN